MINTNIVVELTATDNGKRAKILLEGDLSISNLQGAKDELAKAVDAYSCLDLEVRNVQNFDLAAVQVLHSLHLTAKALGKDLSLKLELPDELQLLVGNSGFGDLEARINMP